MKQSKFYQIKNITEQGYTLCGCDGNVITRPIKDVDKSASAFTVQDAKDGDVVVDKSDGAIGIFQSIGHHPDGGSYNDPSYCFLHCRYDDGFFYADFEHGNEMDSDDIIPATKEQRDTLEKAMADAGYTFDFEKKELKKIEQKPEWSEEDERKFQLLITMCDDIKGDSATYSTMYREMEELKTWLKSLKQRYTWKPSAFHLECIEDAIAIYEKRGINPIGLKEILEELKKLREE